VESGCAKTLKSYSFPTPTPIPCSVGVGKGVIAKSPKSRGFYSFLAEMTAQEAAKVRSRYDAFCKGYDHRSESRRSNDANAVPSFFEHSKSNGADFSLKQILFFFTLWFLFKHRRQVRRMPGQAALQALWKYFYERHHAIHAIITRVLDCAKASFLCEAINGFFPDDDGNKEDTSGEGYDDEDNGSDDKEIKRNWRFPH
jgi:hypothetical protein